MPTTKFTERRAGDMDYAQRLEDWKMLSIRKFDEGAARMEVIEASQEKHLGVLMQNTQMTEDMHKRFNVLESGIKGNEAALAKALDEWKAFSIMKVDEGSDRMTSIEKKQAQHMDILCANTEATDRLRVGLVDLQIGIGDVLVVVSALKGTKKTLGWVGKGALWLGGLAGAWIAIKAALVSDVKIQWPWA